MQIMNLNQKKKKKTLSTHMSDLIYLELKFYWKWQMFCYGIKSTYNGDFLCYVILADMITLLASRAVKNRPNKNDEIALIKRIWPWHGWESAIIVGKLGIHLLNAPNLFVFLFTFWVTLYHFKFFYFCLSLSLVNVFTTSI